jgi:hypothetical protein
MPSRCKDGRDDDGYERVVKLSGGHVLREGAAGNSIVSCLKVVGAVEKAFVDEIIDRSTKLGLCKVS